MFNSTSKGELSHSAYFQNLLATFPSLVLPRPHARLPYMCVEVAQIAISRCAGDFNARKRHAGDFNARERYFDLRRYFDIISDSSCLYKFILIFFFFFFYENKIRKLKEKSRSTVGKRISFVVQERVFPRYILYIYICICSVVHLSLIAVCRTESTVIAYDTFL